MLARLLLNFFVRPRRPRRTFLPALLILLLSVAIQLQFHLQFRAAGYAVLMALIAAAFLLDLTELIALVLTGVFILNWQPALSVELVLLVILPLLFFAARKFLPGQPLVNVLIAAAISFLTFVLTTASSEILKNPGSLVAALAVDTVAAGLVYYVFDTVYVSGQRKI